MNQHRRRTDRHEQHEEGWLGALLSGVILALLLYLTFLLAPALEAGLSASPPAQAPAPAAPKGGWGNSPLSGRQAEGLAAPDYLANHNQENVQ